MKLNKIIFSFLTFFILSSKCYLQNIDYGIAFETNFSSHTNTDPTKPEDGQFQWNSLTTFGVGVYASKEIFEKINITSSLMFRQRGYTEEAQVGFIGEPINFPSLQNRFNYFSADLKLKYKKNNTTKLKISPLIGIGFNWLERSKIESEKIEWIKRVYPVNQYNDNWNKINLNYILGFSLFQLNKYSLDFEFNRSVTPLLNVETLVVKDWIWSIKLNISVHKLLKTENK